MQFKFGYIYPRCNPHQLLSIPLPPLPLFLSPVSSHICKSFNCKTATTNYSKEFNEMGRNWTKNKKKEIGTIDDAHNWQFSFASLCGVWMRAVAVAAVQVCLMHSKCCHCNGTIVAMLRRERAIFLNVPVPVLKREKIYLRDRIAVVWKETLHQTRHTTVGSLMCTCVCVCAVCTLLPSH